MPRDENELDRLRRLREQQIQDRDPRQKNTRLYRDIGRKVEKSRQVSVVQIIREFPARWLYMLIGFFVGLIIGLTITALFDGVWWSQLVALVVVLVLTFVGRVAGLAEDWRKE